MAPAASKQLHARLLSRKEILKSFGIERRVVWETPGTIVTVHVGDVAPVGGRQLQGKLVEKTWSKSRTWSCGGSMQATSEINLAFTGAVKGLVVAPFDATVTTNEGISVFYPYAGKNLKDHFAVLRNFAPREVLLRELKTALVDMLLGLVDIHTQGYVLLDIKDTNALYDPETKAYRLSDAGLCCQAGSSQCGGDISVPCADMERRTPSGERVVDIRKERQKANSFKADVLAVGETLYTLLLGGRPDRINFDMMDQFMNEIPGYCEEELLAMPEEQRNYILFEAFRDRCADMVYDRLWDDELVDNVRPIDADLAHLLGLMLRPAEERFSAEQLLKHKAIKEIVEQEKERLLSVLPVWEERQEAAAQLAKVVKHANASEALLRQMEHITGLMPLCSEHMPEVGSNRSSSSGISTPGSQSSNDSSNGSSRAGSSTDRSGVQHVLPGGRSCAPDCPCSKRPLEPVVSKISTKETPSLAVVNSTIQEEPLPTGEGFSINEQDAASSSEEGPATPGGSHSGNDDGFLPCADSSNNNQESPVASGIISSSVGSTQQLPLPPTMNQLDMADPAAAADCAPGQDPALLQQHAAQGSNINGIKGGSSTGCNPSGTSGSSVDSSELLAAAQPIASSSILSSHPLELDSGDTEASSNLTSHPLELFCDNSEASSNLTSHPLEFFCDNSEAEMIAMGAAAAEDSSLSSHPVIGCDDTEASSSLSSHPMDLSFDNTEAGLTAAGDATAATGSSMASSSVVNSLVDRAKVAVQPEDQGRASCRHFGVIRGVCRLLCL